MCHWMVNAGEVASGFQRVPDRRTSPSTDREGFWVLLLPAFQPFSEPPLFVKLERNRHDHSHAFCHPQHPPGKCSEDKGTVAVSPALPSQVQAGQSRECRLL